MSDPASAGAADSIPVLLKLGKVWELTGEWKKAGVCYQRAFEAAESLHDRHSQARCQAATGDLLRKQGLYAEAADWLGVARACFEADKVLGEPAACRWFLNWYDETPRPEMRTQLLAEVESVLAQRHSSIPAPVLAAKDTAAA